MTWGEAVARLFPLQWLFCLGAVGLAGCSNSNSSADARAGQLIEWSKRNPEVSPATWRATEKLECKPKLLDVCNDGGCRGIDTTKNPPITLTWYPNKGSYKRCDGKSCGTYKPLVSYSGSFANVVMPENAIVFRLTASGEYREVLHLATDTYVYSGTCAAA